MSQDLYATLGLGKDASSSEIKSAYRKVARKYHPDVNKEPGAEAKFKDIQKAYSILSDPQKKQKYDQFGVADDSAAGGQGGFGGFEGFSSGFGGGSFDDIFDTFFGGSRGSSQSGGSAAGEDLRYDMHITLEEAFEGVEKEFDIYHLKVNSAKSQKCRRCNGTGKVTVVQQTMLGTFQQVSTCPECGGTGGVQRDKVKKSIKVTIPAGVDSGNKLRVSGEGNESPSGGSSGDLYVVIMVNDHKYFQREDSNLYLHLELPFTKLILGCSIDVPIVKGVASLKIPAGTQSGTTFRIKSKGLPNLQGYGRGDQYVNVKAVFPKYLSSKEKKIMEEFQSLRGEANVESNINQYIVSK